MTITYKQPWPNEFPTIKMPVLHRVKYGQRPPPAYYNPKGTTFVELVRRDQEVSAWLKENCQHDYYTSPMWIQEQFIEFVDDQDAMWFALRWGC